MIAWPRLQRMGDRLPELDFMVLCDYVRSEGGVVHMMAGGIDRLRPPTLPFAQNLAVAIRLALTRQECEESHDLSLQFRSPERETIAEIRGTLRVQYPDDVPDGWPAFVAITPSFAVPLQSYGIHSFELEVDGRSLKTLRLIVEPSPAPEA